MNDHSAQHNRYLYQIAGTKWLFGPKGGTKLIRDMRFFEDLITGCRYPNQCVVSTLMGVDYIPSFSGDKSLDKRYKREIQSLQMDLEEAEKKALEDELFDRAREYKTQLNDLRKRLKGDFITASAVKRIYKGDILLAFTHCVRQRKRRGLVRLRKEGFVEEAKDLKRSFDVSDRNIVFLKGVSAFNWLLKPDE